MSFGWLHVFEGRLITKHDLRLVSLRHVKRLFTSNLVSKALIRMHNCTVCISLDPSIDVHGCQGIILIFWHDLHTHVKDVRHTSGIITICLRFFVWDWHVHN